MRRNCWKSYRCDGILAFKLRKQREKKMRKFFLWKKSILSLKWGHSPKRETRLNVIEWYTCGTSNPMWAFPMKGGHYSRKTEKSQYKTWMIPQLKPLCLKKSKLFFLNFNLGWEILKARSWVASKYRFGNDMSRSTKRDKL